MHTQTSRMRSPFVTAALIEGPLFLLFIATYPLIHSGGIGMLGMALSFPQMPGLIAAGVIEGLLTRLFGFAPTYIGIPLFFALIFLVQWLLIAAVVAAWRLWIRSGPWSSLS